MKQQKRIARWAGLMYLLVILFGTFAELYARAQVIVPGDVSATASNIITQPHLFRMGFISDLIMQACFFLLPLFLYKLLKHVNEDQARLMVLSVTVGVAIMCLNMLNHFAVILLLEDGVLSQNFSTAQINEWVTFFLRLHGNGYYIAQLFFGIWLFPLGYLSYHSKLIPRIIGILLIIACFSFLIDFFLFFLFPNYSGSTSAAVTFPTVIAEFSMCLWLLIVGVRQEQPSIGQ